MLYPVLYTPTSLPMMPQPGTQALVVSGADKIVISALSPAHSSEITYFVSTPQQIITASLNQISLFWEGLARTTLIE